MIKVAKLTLVEPVLMFFMMGSYLQFFTLQHLIYRKVCLNKYSVEVCDNIEDDRYDTEEKFVQTQTSYWIIYVNIAETIPAIFSSLTLGSWTDRVGRKKAMSLPSIGASIFAILLIVFSADLSIPIPYILIGNFILGTTGAFVTITFTCFSYAADITGRANRTRRVGILESMTFAGNALGSLLGGVLLKAVKFVGVFSIYLALNLCIVLYISIFLKEAKRPPVNGGAALDTTTSSSDVRSLATSMEGHEEVAPGKPGKNQLKELCQLDNIKETVMVCFKRRDHYGRAHIILAITALFTLQLCGSGEGDVAILYTKRKFGWVSTQQGYYLFLEAAMKWLGLCTIMPLLTRFTPLGDTTIGLLGVGVRIAAYLLIGLASHGWMMYLGACMMVMGGLPGASVRSLLSKLVDQSEEGRIFAFSSSLETLCSMVSSFLFNALYPATLNFLDGGYVYVLMALILVITAILLLWIGDSMRNVQAYTELKERRERRSSSPPLDRRDSLHGDI